MRLIQGVRLFTLSTILSTLAVLMICATGVSAQTGQDQAQTQVQTQESIAIQRGYRTGYSDGYMAGYRDTIDSKTKSYRTHAEYAKADRAFNADYGSIADYRDGYQQGFEAGYATGFERRSFDQNLPGAPL